MAFDTLTAVAVAEQGETCMRPNILNRFTIDGDDAYPTGGTTGFQDTVRAIVDQRVTLSNVTGYGFTAGAITHFVRYNKTADTLLVYVLAGTQVPNATDLSGVSFDLAATSE